MSLYPGDIYTFLLSITVSSGAAPNVTVVPQLQILALPGGSGVLGSPVTMTLLAGTQAIYVYQWSIPTNQVPGDYCAIISYASDGITVSSRFLDQIRIGDSRITGVVALDSTVAKDLTVAKASVTAKTSDLASISPDTSATVLAIKAKTDSLPTNPASEDLASTILSRATDARDGILGTMNIDRTVSPVVLTILRVADSSLLATFNLTEDSTSTSRTRQ